MRIVLALFGIVICVVLVGGMLTAQATANTGPILEAAEGFEDLTVSQLVDMMLAVAQWFLILVGVLAIVMALWGAFLLTTGGASPDQIEKGQKTLLWAIIGVAVAILAFSVVVFTRSLFEAPPPTQPPGQDGTAATQVSLCQPCGTGGVTCQQGLTCTSGRCLPPGVQLSAGMCAACPNPDLVEGGCPFNTTCSSDLVCVPVSTPPPDPAGTNEPCPNPDIPGGGCPFGTTCNPTTLTCVAGP